MINETLKNALPALPEGYRWHLYRMKNNQVNRGYITYLEIQKKGAILWRSLGKEIVLEDYADDLDKSARKLYNLHINKKEDVVYHLLGVTDK